MHLKHVLNLLRNTSSSLQCKGLIWATRKLFAKISELIFIYPVDAPACEQGLATHTKPAVLILLGDPDTSVVNFLGF
jgi:hypothetical protein